MNLAFGFGLVALGLVGLAMVTALQSLLADEARAWLRRLPIWLVRSAARQLPPAERADYERDWSAEIAGWSDRPVSAIVKAMHLRWGATGVRGSICGCSVRGGRLKRALDVGVASLFLIAFGPLIIGIAWAIRRGSSGSVLVRSVRVGRDGEEFRLLKFRTVDGDGDRFRFTRVGRMLRRTHLDEIPQFINVLNGDMGIVGPRPLMPDIQESCGSEAIKLRCAVRPGLTGPAQLTIDGAPSLEEIMRADTEYARSRSTATDLALIGRTLTAALRRSHRV